MGAALSAPLAALGSCGGGCLAAGCCKLATVGSTGNTKAARCVLFWLQVVALTLAVLLTWNPKGWLDGVCGKLPDFGICECYGRADDQSCYHDQIIYRTESSVMIVFLFLLILCVSGCARHAAKSFPVGKFLIFLVLFAVTLFLPNDVLTVFGTTASSASSVYLVAQTILLVDFAYSWNELWHGNAIQASVRNIDRRGEKMWLAAIVAASVIFVIIGLVAAILLCATFHDGGALALVIFTFVVSLVLLVVSISDWCKHGALLTSSVVLAYMMWLSYEALSMMPGTSSKLLPNWAGLLICTVSLTAFSFTAGFGGSGFSGTATQGRDQAFIAEQGGAPTDGANDDVPEGLDVWDFTVQCVVHAAAAVYIAASLAPSKDNFTFASRIIAVVLSLVLYGWSLIAPKVLNNREFS